MVRHVILCWRNTMTPSVAWMCLLQKDHSNVTDRILGIPGFADILKSVCMDSLNFESCIELLFLCMGYSWVLGHEESSILIPILCNHILQLRYLNCMHTPSKSLMLLETCRSRMLTSLLLWKFSGLATTSCKVGYDTAELAFCLLGRAILHVVFLKLFPHLKQFFALEPSALELMFLVPHLLLQLLYLA